MTEITIEHDPRSPWVWDRAALEAACEELGIDEPIHFKQVFGLYPSTRGSLGRAGTVYEGTHTIEVEAMLDNSGEAASGVTWHELGHTALGVREKKKGIDAWNRYGDMLLYCDENGIYNNNPSEVVARRTAEMHRDDRLTLTVRESGGFAPEEPVWRKPQKEAPDG